MGVKEALGLVLDSRGFLPPQGNSPFGLRLFKLTKNDFRRALVLGGLWVRCGRPLLANLQEKETGLARGG